MAASYMRSDGWFTGGHLVLSLLFLTLHCMFHGPNGVEDLKFSRLRTMSAPTPHGHNRIRVADDNEEDPLDAMISRTGCADAHYAVQECMAEHQDWRKCQQQVERFKGCMATYQKQKVEELQRRHKLARETS